MKKEMNVKKHWFLRHNLLSRDWCLTLILLICTINFLARIFFVNMPLHLDETTAMNGVIVVLNNHLNPFVDFFGYKPPVMFLIPSLLSYFTGPNIIIPRLLIYFCSSLLLYFVYLIGKDIFKNKKIGLWSVILLFVYPMFICQSFVFQDQIPTALFFTMSFYFLYSEKFIWYIVSSVLLVMTRELGIISIIIFLFFDLFIYRKKVVESIISHGVPLMVFGVWMLLNKYLLGWYLWPFNNKLSISRIRINADHTLITD